MRGAANDEWVRGAANDEWVRGAAILILYNPLYIKSNTLSIDLYSDSTVVHFRYFLITTAYR